MLHMDLFDPTYAIVTDDFSRFSWVFFLSTKGETSRFYKDKGIKRECSVAKTPQQNGVAERRNRILIEVARTMLAESKLPTTFWVEAVNTACYVLNRALMTNPHNKTSYELIRGRPPLIDFMKPFGCIGTILNTRNNLGTFKGKANEGYFVGPDWLFDIDSLTISMDYVLVVVGNQTNGIAGSKENLVAGQDDKKKELKKEYILIPICTTGPLISQGTKDSAVDAGKKAPKVDESEASDNGGKNDQVPRIYQMDVKSAFLYGRIEEEVYVYQPPGFEDPNFPNKVYKVEKAHYGLHQAPRACQEKYMAKVLKKFDFVNVKIASTPMESNKPLIKDEEAEDVDVHLYRSMIGLLMYLIASRPDITFVVCACVRFQVNPKTSHLYAVKRIFRYLKCQPKLGLWYPEDSPFNLEAYFNSDYAKAGLDRKSTTGGCQSLGKRLILWQCKKQTIITNSTTEAEYVAAVNCCRQVIWIQNQLLDYGFNLMNTKIYIDNESTICIVKNPVFYYKTKHIEIRHHFIRDSYEKKLIQVIRIHTDKNVAELLTKAFDIDDSKGWEMALWIHMKLQLATAKMKKVNDQEQIQALVDKRKVIISEDNIRSDLRLDDAEGTACLINEEIFEGLARMGAKTTAWNEISSTMASAIICLTDN
nr:putative reverse transcriptase, RNA-dependent DNA polymerase [Tanacetum cinerariifolium]GEY36301.1 putative reverse transcriptase, RNA-dependent DNA polymerase [Tanacetum cinerariifolium]